MNARTLTTIIAMGMLLARCAPQAPPAAAPAPPPLPPHQGPPPAISCNVAPFKVADGGSTDIHLTVSNEGGYCAATLTTASGRPFDAPLVPVLPLHGTPRVIRYNGHNSVEYTPDTGYAGHDSFVVKMIKKGEPGYTTLNISVSVTGH